MTVFLIVVTTLAGILISVLAAAGRRSGYKWLRQAIGVYVELIRNTPFLVQLFFIFFGLPSLGVRLTAFEAAVLAMTINLTAYTIEILRAGIGAVPPGQREAGLALGVSAVAVFIYVVLPQAVAAVYPALVSQIVITMLESAV